MMETAAEEHHVFKMLNDLPPQRHKLGTIILNGDTHKRQEHHLRPTKNTKADKNTKMVITRVPRHPQMELDRRRPTRQAIYGP